MKSSQKKSLTIASASALAASMAHGDILYTPINQTIVAGGNDTYTFDLNQDGSADFLIEFDNNNALKPYINDSVGTTGATLSYVLSDPSTTGLPLATNGMLIDQNYESAQSVGYFYENTGDTVVGDWDSGGTNIDAYVGLELIDTNGVTHYGWAQFIYNSKTVDNGVTGILTIVDCAMNTDTNGIYAGQTAPFGPPSIVTPPASETNAIGGVANFEVIAIGSPAPTYQWMAGAVGSGIYTNLSDSATVSGVTNSTLTISNLTSANAEDYIVLVSNVDGTVSNSPPATLTVLPLLITGLSPSPVELYAGGTAHITASCQSASSTQFQWLKNGAPLSDGGRVSGSHASTLTIDSLSLSDSGNYSVIASNSYGAVTSKVDAVTVITPPSPYQQAVAQLSPVCYYSFSETNDPAMTNVIAYDFVGGLNGVYGYQVENGNSNYNIAGPQLADGYAGFPSNNTAMLVGPTSHSPISWVVTPPPNLDTNTVTYVCWLYPTEAQAAWNVILSYRSQVAGTANGMNFSGTGDGDLAYHWNDNEYGYDSGLYVPISEWSMAAEAVSATNVTFYLFNTSEMLSATNVYNQVVQAFNTDGNFGGDSVDGNFVGELDEIAIFNQTLSSNQLAGLFNVAVTGINPNAPVTITIQPAGAGNVTLTWPQGTLLQAPALTGPWTTNAATSPYTTATSGTQQFYKVIVQ